MLHLSLIHLLGCSLKETALRASKIEIEEIKSVSIHKRLQACGDWFSWMIREMSGIHPPVSTKGHRIVCVDGTSLSEPGSTGTDYRIHYEMELGTFQCEYLELTDVKKGETLRRFPVKKGDLFLGDRIYANPAGVAHVKAGGGDVIVRLNPKSLPLYTGQGDRISVLDQVDELLEEETKGWEAWVHPKEGNPIRGRLVAFKLDKEMTNRAKRRALRKACKKNKG